MDFHQLREALEPYGFRKSFALGPLALVKDPPTEDERALVVWCCAPGKAAVERGVVEVFRGSFDEVGAWLTKTH